MALGTAMNLQRSVRAPDRGGVVRFDVALVDGGRTELPLQHHVGRGEPRLDVSLFQHDVLGHVAGRVGKLARRLHAQVRVQDRRAGGDRRLGVEHGVPNVVLHLDQPHGFGGDVRRRCSHRRHRVAVIERGTSRHDVHDLEADGVAEGPRAFGERQRNIVRGHGGQDAGEGLGP